MMPLAEDAIALGWPCFPCGADKKPLTAHGFKDSTTDPTAIKRLFADAASIGVPTGRSTFVAVDLDVKREPSGLLWLEQNRHRLPRTRTIRTGSGGMHLYFQHPAGDIELRNTAGRLAPNVDTRGVGGYVVTPPSPGYTVADDAPIAPMPDWLVEAWRARPQAPPPPPPKPRRHETGDGSPYGLAALDAETQAILQAPFGQQETTLNAAALKIGALVAGGELLHGVARQALVAAGRAMANEGGREPWTAQDIEAKVARGMADGAGRPRQAPERPFTRYSALPPDDVPPAEDREEPEPDHFVEGEGENAPADHLAEDDGPLIVESGTWQERDIPQRPWIATGYFMRGTVTLLAGPGSAGKSMLTLVWNCGLATGKPVHRMTPRLTCRVGTYNVEDDQDEQRRRISAALRSLDLTPADIDGRLWRITPRDIGTLIVQDQASGRFSFTRAWVALDDIITAHNLDILFLDPFAELHTSEENDNTALRTVVAKLRELARRHNIAIVLIHHTRKGAMAGDPDGIRGASAIVGAVRVALTVSTMTDAEADRMAVPAENRRDLFRVDGAKMNYAPPLEAEWFQRQPYDLDNGETVAAAIPWEPETRTPDASDLMTFAHQVRLGADDGHPWAAKMSTHATSLRTACQRCGIKGEKAERIALDYLRREGFGIATWPGRDRKGSKGWRSPDGLPQEDWK